MCYEGYWLDSNLDTCNTYTENLECIYFHKFKDECLKCRDEYMLSSDNKKCLQKLTNCKKHSTTATAITCTLCDFNYALNNTNDACIFMGEDYCWFKV